MARFVDVEDPGGHWVDLREAPDHHRDAILSEIEAARAVYRREQAAAEKRAEEAALLKTDEGLRASGQAAAEEFLGRHRHSYFENEQAR